MRNYAVVEPAVVDVQIIFFGAISPFDVNVTVEVDFASAAGK